MCCMYFPWFWMLFECFSLNAGVGLVYWPPWWLVRCVAYVVLVEGGAPPSRAGLLVPQPWVPVRSCSRFWVAWGLSTRGRARTFSFSLFIYIYTCLKRGAGVWGKVQLGPLVGPQNADFFLDFPAFRLSTILTITRMFFLNLFSDNCLRKLRNRWKLPAETAQSVTTRSGELETRSAHHQGDHRAHNRCQSLEV